jgi:hypothetical protein
MQYSKEQEIKPASKPRADELIEKYELELSARKNFEGYWQILHDYFYIEASNVNKSYSPGSELDPTYLWDATTLDAGDVLASGFMNYLTPPSSKWFRLRHKNPNFSENKEIADFLEAVTEEVNYALDRSNFYSQMFPNYKSSGIMGTGLLFEEEDVTEDIFFSNIPIGQAVVVEDAKGKVVSYFFEFEYTVEQAASRWGVEALSTDMQQELKNGKTKQKHKFLLYVSKRNIREIQKQDKKNLPIEASWIDVKGRTIVEESGYHEFPAMCYRFDKRPGTPWGYSPAMKALPFARMLNAIAKTNLRSMMKHTDPPIALPQNAFIMPLNMNPRAVNYYNPTKMQNNSQMFPFGNSGDPQAGLAAVEYYSNQVKSLMFNDAFMMFNSLTKKMNNPEVMERINEKMTLLGPAVGRAISEVTNPVILRTIGILYRKGRLPDLPDEMLEDPGFEIESISVLAQAQKRSEMNALINGLTLVGQLAQFSPEVLDKVDSDKVVNEAWAITGAPVQVLRDDVEIKKIREGRAQAAVEQQKMMQVAGGAQIAKDAGSAAAGFAKANESGKKE